MRRPWVVLVTGEPGSGKTTLGLELARALRLPFLSRDQVRGGTLATDGLWTNHMVDPTPREVAVDAFLQIVEQSFAVGVSLVIEFLVFDERRESLRRLEAAANVIVVRTECDDAADRAHQRDLVDPLLNRPPVINALGFESVAAYLDGTSGQRERVRAQMVLDHDLPCLTVRTDAGYDPSLTAITDWVVDQTRR